MFTQQQSVTLRASLCLRRAGFPLGLAFGLCVGLLGCEDDPQATPSPEAITLQQVTVLRHLGEALQARAQASSVTLTPDLGSATLDAPRLQLVLPSPKAGPQASGPATRDGSPLEGGQMVPARGLTLRADHATVDLTNLSGEGVGRVVVRGRGRVARGGRIRIESATKTLELLDGVSVETQP